MTKTRFTRLKRRGISHHNFASKLKNYMFSYIFADIDQITVKARSGLFYNQLNQEFFLHDEVAEKSFLIPPYGSKNFTAIIFSPKAADEAHATLYLRNNLTGVSIIKLHGIGEMGKLSVTDIITFDPATKVFLYTQ